MLFAAIPIWNYRRLLIYDQSRQQMAAGQAPNLRALNAAADIIRTLVEDDHEKQEDIKKEPAWR